MGDVHVSAPLADGNHVGLPDSNGHSTAGASCSPSEAPADEASRASEQLQGVARQADSRSQPAAGVRWQLSEQQIDRSALMTRDPILFYDDVMLHLSELDDNGISQLTVKARGDLGMAMASLGFAGMNTCTHARMRLSVVRT